MLCSYLICVFFILQYNLTVHGAVNDPQTECLLWSKHCDHCDCEMYKQHQDQVQFYCCMSLWMPWELRVVKAWSPCWQTISSDYFGAHMCLFGQWHRTLLRSRHQHYCCCCYGFVEWMATTRSRSQDPSRSLIITNDEGKLGRMVRRNKKTKLEGQCWSVGSQKRLFVVIHGGSRTSMALSIVFTIEPCSLSWQRCCIQITVYSFLGHLNFHEITWNDTN